MKRILPAWSVTALGGMVLVCLAAAPVAAQAVASGSASSGSSGGGGAAVASSGGGAAVASGGGGAAVSSGGGGSSATSNGGGSSNGGGGGGIVSAPSHGGNGASRMGATGGSGYAAPRSSEGPRTPGPGRNGPGRDPDGHQPVGSAVPRGSVPSNNRTGSTVVIPGGYYGGYYDPWWFGAGYMGMYSGYYDPWYGGYPTNTQSSSSTYGDEGALKLKIKPREAEVYVDGYFVGIVDDFDGLFQKLRVESGAHRVEVRAPGYETLVIQVRIAADETTTYHGELKKIP